MKSKAHIQGHPIHPMMVAFPIAFIYGSFVADAAGWAGGWPSVAATGAYLSIAAVVMGLAAGVPGLIDYLYAVPPNSSGKRRTTWHMAVNVTALANIALGWVFRDWSTLMPGTATVLLELAGVGLVTWGGWMGGTLVYRNQIGVDHRHAHAGKWQEETIDVQPGQPVVVAKADELKPGQMKLLVAGGRRIVLARTDEGYVAFDDRCTHRGGPLADGVLICSTVACPWHGSRFDAASGAVQAGPAEKPIGAYKVTQSGDEVRLVVPETAERA
jgi:nitrite reductase/ring-hydroxylating ferredoxin subunit/uncharacterized membrane protein